METDVYVVAERRRLRIQARWAIALFALVSVAIVLLAIVGPSAGAAGGCGGG